MLAMMAHSDAQDAKVDASNGATATSPSGATRPLGVGSNVRSGDKVQTSASGSAHVSFSDQSSVSVGRNSTVGIDKYSYDKNTKSGSAVVSAVKGALRYVGGQISHGDGAEVKTPAATLGIRGGIVTVMLSLPPNLAASNPNLAGSTVELVIAQFGTITITNNAGQFQLPNGFATIIGSPNSPILTPFKLSDAMMQIIVQILTSTPFQTGGVNNPPTNQATPLPPGFSLSFLPDPSPPPGSDPLSYLGIFSAGNSAAQNQAQTNQALAAQILFNLLNQVNQPPPCCDDP
jgi:FecR protein